MNELPSGWNETPLETVVDIFDSKRIPLNSDEREQRISGKASHLLFPYYGATGQVGVIDDYLFDGDYILLGEDGVPFFDPLRHKAYRAHGKFWVNNHAHVLQAINGLSDFRFIERYLNSFDYKGYVSGSTRLKLTQASMRSMPVLLAPLPEQKRIADKLDAVLARVDACRDRLDSIPAIIKRFRQSVLAAATSGKLTEDWRTDQSCTRAQELMAEIQEAQQAANIRVRGGAIFPSLSDLPDEVDLPDTWAVAGFDAMAAPVVNALKAGPFGSALKKNIYVANGYKIYGQEQVIAGDESLGDYFIDVQKYEELSSCAVTSGDILISLVGTIGRVLILSDRCAAGIINPRLVKLSLYPSLNREFVSLYLQSPLAQNFFKAKSHGGTMDILNLGILRELPILLPPITEQTEIVRRVESLFACADRLEARYATARAQVEKLTPATHAKAFRGELVPQDLKDEPASELLERIRAQRSDQSANKLKRGCKIATKI